MTGRNDILAQLLDLKKWWCIRGLGCGATPTNTFGYPLYITVVATIGNKVEVNHELFTIRSGDLEKANWSQAKEMHAITVYYDATIVEK